MTAKATRRHSDHAARLAVRTSDFRAAGALDSVVPPVVEGVRERRVTTADRNSAWQAAVRYHHFIHNTAKDGKAISCPVHPDRGVQSPEMAIDDTWPPVGSPCSVAGCEEVLREVPTAKADERLAAAQRMREETD